MGATLTTDLVHISCRSMVAIICRPDEVAHELRPRAGEHGAQRCPTPPRPAARRPRKRNCAERWPGYSSRRKRKSVAQIRLAAGIDDMVGASQQLIDVLGIGAGRGVLAQHGKVGGDLAVEQGHLLQLRARKLRQADSDPIGQAAPRAGPSAAAAWRSTGLRECGPWTRIQISLTSIRRNWWPSRCRWPASAAASSRC